MAKGATKKHPTAPLTEALVSRVRHEIAAPTLPSARDDINNPAASR